MIEVRQTEQFTIWFDALRDRQAKARIVARIRRVEAGNPGQYRMLAGGVGELKVDFGPGYRIYFAQRGPVLVILLCGGDKSSQQKDIQAAMKLAAGL
ncbi:MAG: type II toxin-antitoxin system RelE/ParE family toxin [Solimonas sp.]